MIPSRRAWVLLFVAASGFGAVIACGDDDDDGVKPPANSSSSGSSGADAAPAPPTEKSACEAYLDSYCAKYDACSSVTNAGKLCLGYKELCPEYYFLPGSTRTIENMVQCAKDIAALSCDQWRAGYRPDCQTDGTLDDDAGCVSSVQCKSGICSNNLDARCGNCAKTSTPDGPCDPTVQRQVCPRNYTCVKNVCKPIDVKPLAEGQPCNVTGAVCGEGLTCYAAGGGDGTERCAKPTSNQCGAAACDSTQSYCRAFDDGGVTCVPFKQNGEACDNAGQQCNSATAYCKLTSAEIGTCTAYPKVGEPCGQTAGGAYVSCAPEVTCVITDKTANTGVCTTPGGRGAACSDTQPCKRILACRNGTCQPPDPSCPADAGL
jgi:hypothetical protein